MNEINSIEKLFLANIDLENGPDHRQINLVIQLNLFKIILLKVNKLGLALCKKGKVFYHQMLQDSVRNRTV